jgi:hypothetical protein
MTNKKYGHHTCGSAHGRRVEEKNNSTPRFHLLVDDNPPNDLVFWICQIVFILFGAFAGYQTKAQP